MKMKMKMKKKTRQKKVHPKTESRHTLSFFGRRMASRKKKKTFFVGGNNGVSLIAGLFACLLVCLFVCWQSCGVAHFGVHHVCTACADPLKERGWVQMDDEKATNVRLPSSQLASVVFPLLPELLSCRCSTAPPRLFPPFFLFFFFCCSLLSNGWK